MQITRARLEKFRKKLRLEIQLLRQEINDMKTGDAGLGHSIINDYTKGYARPQAVVGYDENKEKKLRSRLERKEQEAAVIRQWIEEIEDVVTRQVFKLYYIDGLSWAEVAKQIGYRGKPDYPRVCIRDKYLKEKRIK